MTQLVVTTKRTALWKEKSKRNRKNRFASDQSDLSWCVPSVYTLWFTHASTFSRLIKS